jgi:hypothetical protein
VVAQRRTPKHPVSPILTDGGLSGSGRDRPVPHVHCSLRVIAVEQFESDGGAAWVVEQPDPVPEQYRRDVQVDLVDQPALEELSSARGREDLEFFKSAASRPIRTASATSQLRRVTPSLGCKSSGW